MALLSAILRAARTAERSSISGAGCEIEGGTGKAPPVGSSIFAQLPGVESHCSCRDLEPRQGEPT